MGRTTAAIFVPLRLDQQITHVLGMAQRDVQELYATATTDVETNEAHVAADSLNTTWHLIATAPLLLFHLKALLPLAEQALRSNRSEKKIKILQSTRQTIMKAEQVIVTS